MTTEIENTPLTEATYFIMLSLSHKPRHGYAIMKDVRILSEDRLVLSTGTLYGVLKRLLKQGWIKRTEGEQDKNKYEEAGRIRKAYALTNLGRRVLKTEIARLQLMVDAAHPRSIGAKA